MKTLGVIGGMGPAATVDFFSKLIALTKADADQQHLPVIIDSNTHIPDRSAAILHGAPSPLPELCKSARRLEQAGAELIVMTCNTAHYYFDAVQSSVSVPMLHIARETAKAARDSGPEALALLSTTGTLQSGVYTEAFSREAPGLRLLTPDTAGQAALMSMIYDGVKAGKREYDVQSVADLLERLRAQGAQSFILGCTELPLAFATSHIDGSTLDPTVILARAALRECGAPLRD